MGRITMNRIPAPRQRPVPPDLRDEWSRLLETMPDAVKAAVTPEPWDMYRLHALDLPVRDMPIDDLAWLLDVPLWAVDGVPFRVTPNAVWASPRAYRDQFVRTMASELACPIHIMRFRGRWIILDGVHRLLKAHMLGYVTVRAMILGKDDYASILFSGDDE